VRHLVILCGLLSAAPLAARQAVVQLPSATRLSLLATPQDTARACTPQAMPGAVWWGTDRSMTMKRFVSYMAPIIWFSPDEPSLHGAEGAAIRHPEPYTFEPPADHPVMYYQIKDLQVRERAEATEAFQRDETDIDASRIDLRDVVAGHVSFYAYYQTEEGLGAHPHDIEPTEFRFAVLRGTDIPDRVGNCPDDLYFIIVTRTSAEAHGLVWFWNVLDTDESTFFPMHLFVEEGKHAFATDKNGDGVFTPGYDVNIRINDAWGVRDIIRTGMLFSGGYQQWMTKVRHPEHRVIPPLPEDSPLQGNLERRVDGMDLAVYEIRPFPSSELAGDDHALRHLMENQERPGWPELGRIGDARQFGKFVNDGAAVKSLSISLYTDGNLGFGLVFPLFIVAHLNDPMTGGYLLHRMHFKDKGLRDWGWQIMYMPSASRWLDTYLAAGYERDDEEDASGQIQTYRDFVFETGVKFRVNIAHSPLKFLPFTDYWGVRFGIKNRGFWSVDRLTYVIEFGAGSF